MQRLGKMSLSGQLRWSQSALIPLVGALPGVSCDAVASLRRPEPPLVRLTEVPPDPCAGLAACPVPLLGFSSFHFVHLEGVSVSL